MNIGNKLAEKIITVYFFALAVMMYYFLDQTLTFKLSITFRHLFGLIIIASGLVCFMIKPDFPRAVVGFKSACVMGLPLLVTLGASMLVWIIERSDAHVITRGLSYYFIFMNSFHAALAAAMDTPKIAFAPRLLLFSVPSALQMEFSDGAPDQHDENGVQLSAQAV